LHQNWHVQSPWLQKGEKLQLLHAAFSPPNQSNLIASSPHPPICPHATFVILAPCGGCDLTWSGRAPSCVHLQIVYLLNNSLCAQLKNGSKSSSMLTSGTS
ncbi:hypothetical protein N333_07753, partial [Nestor notabilis]